MVGRGDRGHKLVAVGALVVDVQQLAVRKVGVGNGDHHRLALLRLPVGIAVVNGNVVGALHLLALRHGALHLGGTHRGLLGHLAHHLELRLRDLLLDRPHRQCAVVLLRRRIRKKAPREQNQQEGGENLHQTMLSACVNVRYHKFVLFILFINYQTVTALIKDKGRRIGACTPISPQN